MWAQFIDRIHQSRSYFLRPFAKIFKHRSPATQCLLKYSNTDLPPPNDGCSKESIGSLPTHLGCQGLSCPIVQGGIRSTCHFWINQLPPFPNQMLKIPIPFKSPSFSKIRCSDQSPSLSKDCKSFEIQWNHERWDARDTGKGNDWRFETAGPNAANFCGGPRPIPTLSYSVLLCLAAPYYATVRDLKAPLPLQHQDLDNFLITIIDPVKLLTCRNWIHLCADRVSEYRSFCK